MGFRLVPLNYFDADHCADLAVTSEASASYAVENLQSNVRSDTWRSSSTLPQTITGSFDGNARQISHLSIWPALGGSLIGYKIAVRMWSDVAQTTLVRDIAATEAFTPTGGNWGTFLWGIQQWGVDDDDRTARLGPFVTWFTPVAVSVFEITISSAGAVDTPYFEASRIWLGDYEEAPYLAGSGASPQWRSGSEIRRRTGGSLDRLRRWIKRELRFETIFTTEADRAKWSDLNYLCDPANETIVSLFQDGTRRDRDFTVMGSWEVLNPFVFENSDFHKLQVAIVES